MTRRVTVIDCGIGNLYSVARAFEVSGADVVFASSPGEIAQAGHLVLPGVGAFESGMAGLRQRDLVEPIRAHASAGKPLLGICLGMQMLASESFEFGEYAGLALVPGRVVPLPRAAVDGTPIKVPRIGWAELACAPDASWAKTELDGTREGDGVYLVHSYEFRASFAADRLAVSDFGGHAICTVIRRGSVIGCQFHPEKSGPVGLGILRRFLER